MLKKVMAVAVAFTVVGLFAPKAHAQGQGPTPLVVHSTTLKWTPSTSTGVLKNCVYQSVTSGGPYTNIACPATTTSYVDLNVIQGATKYYVVTAWDGTTESAYSNEAKATTPISPNPPAAPTGMTSSVQ